MARLYPRKSTVFFSVLLAVLVIGFSWYSRFGQNGKVSYKAGQNALAEKPYDYHVTSAADNSWQKKFLAGDASSTVKYKTNVSATQSAKDEPLTMTDQLGREFLVKFMQMQQAGLVTDEKTIGNVTDQLIAESINNAPIPKRLTIDSIKVVDIPDYQIFSNYANSVSNIMANYMPRENEADIAENALSNDDMSVLTKIDPIIAAYEKSENALRALPVPKGLAQFHLDLMNGINIQIFNAKALRHVDTDPVLALGALNFELTGLQSINDSVNNIRQYYTSMNMPFGYQ
ncbi:MAG: hypothetical protein M1459_01160 [Patescibacteria group bacterium]|nr:hypothetical protein [Patescibacteria group bacterium]